MRPKHIITAVLALAGLTFGAWNWMQYFKKNGPAPAVNIQPLHPVSKVEQQFKAEQAAEAQLKQAAEPEQGSTANPAAAIPRTIVRNPFLTSEEERAIASGEVIELSPNDQTSAVAPDMSGLPQVQLQGVIQDNVNGVLSAIVGGKFYRKGDMLGEEQVVSVNSNSLVLEQNGRRRVIRITGAAADSGGAFDIRMKKAP